LTGRNARAHTFDPAAAKVPWTIARAAGFDRGGVEYLVNDRDGRIYFYDFNALSNFVTDAVRVVGFDLSAVLVDYLVARGRLRAPVRARR